MHSVVWFGACWEDFMQDPPAHVVTRQQCLHTDEPTFYGRDVVCRMDAFCFGIVH